MANPARAWQGNKNSARDRFLAGGYFSAHHQPKFELSLADRFFTVGSCFAREIEYKLAPFGVPLLLRNQGIERRFFDSWKDGDDAPGADALYAGVFNKYTTASIEHDLRRTILRESYENEGLIELDTDKWFDPHASGLKLLPLEQALANRAKIAEAMQLVRQADVVVMTLGQTESWLDTATGIAMNAHPGPAALRKFGDRFFFVDHSYAETIAQVDRTIQLIRRECNPAMRFILTVSPVPFNATFRPQDVVVGHQSTKAMLRTVAEELFRSYDFVDYFPSYEMVINTPRELAWLDDQLHVAGKMVEHIMQRFYSLYYPQGAVLAAQ
ncbi:GSCFA domain-containing protein [Siccirubricoccus sp. KC 17139]|uniref:GSCFA domain-containing protein n=1 Tax=Siccirubricoccus soli TaxID=2899147 RepID=A0ABT1D9N0_9PROT|nr:GSCFA domain-containing protein [Siccirubricoccus soli]MCO6418646.1 GSCFA domain-containing protein [Siccirubricoccus soli]MCP2684781.1 GSCFA domain-containing protein [Siccirubricoccus soli]